jgi:hypothetical protein
MMARPPVTCLGDKTEVPSAQEYPCLPRSPCCASCSRIARMPGVRSSGSTSRKPCFREKGRRHHPPSIGRQPQITAYAGLVRPACWAPVPRRRIVLQHAHAPRVLAVPPGRLALPDGALGRRFTAASGISRGVRPTAELPGGLSLALILAEPVLRAHPERHVSPPGVRVVGDVLVTARRRAGSSRRAFSEHSESLQQIWGDFAEPRHACGPYGM